MSNRSNINVKLPTPPTEITMPYFGRLLKVIESFMFSITAIRDWVVSTLIIQDVPLSGYNLSNGNVYADANGVLRISLSNVAASTGNSMTISDGTVTVTTS